MATARRFIGAVEPAVTTFTYAQQRKSQEQRIAEAVTQVIEAVMRLQPTVINHVLPWQPTNDSSEEYRVYKFDETRPGVVPEMGRSPLVRIKEETLLVNTTRKGLAIQITEDLATSEEGLAQFQVQLAALTFGVVKDSDEFGLDHLDMASREYLDREFADNPDDMRQNNVTRMMDREVMLFGSANTSIRQQVFDIAVALGTRTLQERYIIADASQAAAQCACLAGPGQVMLLNQVQPAYNAAGPAYNNYDSVAERVRASGDAKLGQPSPAAPALFAKNIPVWDTAFGPHNPLKAVRTVGEYYPLGGVKGCVGRSRKTPCIKIYDQDRDDFYDIRTAMVIKAARRGENSGNGFNEFLNEARNEQYVNSAMEKFMAVDPRFRLAAGGVNYEEIERYGDLQGKDALTTDTLDDLVAVVVNRLGLTNAERTGDLANVQARINAFFANTGKTNGELNVQASRRSRPADSATLPTASSAAGTPSSTDAGATSDGTGRSRRRNKERQSSSSRASASTSRLPTGARMEELPSTDLADLEPNLMSIKRRLQDFILAGHTAVEIEIANQILHVYIKGDRGAAIIANLAARGPFLFRYLLFRFPVHEMSSMLITLREGRVGNLLFGVPLVDSGTDVSRKYHEYNVTYRIGAKITQPGGIVRLHDIAFCSYYGGNNNKIVGDDKDAQSLFENRTIADPSVFVVEICPGEEPENPIAFSGWCENVYGVQHRSQSVHPRSRSAGPSYSSALFYRYALKTAAIDPEAFDRMDVITHTLSPNICFRGAYIDETGTKYNNTGHLGVTKHGVQRMRNGNPVVVLE